MTWIAFTTFHRDCTERLGLEEANRGNPVEASAFNAGVLHTQHLPGMRSKEVLSMRDVSILLRTLSPRDEATIMSPFALPGYHVAEWHRLFCVTNSAYDHVMSITLSPYHVMSGQAEAVHRAA